MEDGTSVTLKDGHLTDSNLAIRMVPYGRVLKPGSRFNVKLGNAGDLKLVDRFENVQEYKSIQIFEGEDMKDVTDQFESRNLENSLRSFTSLSLRAL